MAAIQRPKVKRRRPEVLKREEEARVFDAAPTLNWRAFLTTA